MNHPATRTAVENPPAPAYLAVLWSILLVLPAVTSLSGGSGAGPAKVGVLVYLDDSDYHWAYVGSEADSNALCATVEACGQLALSLNYSMSQYGAFVSEIGGLKAPADFSWWWYLLLWNGTKSAWQEAPVGASDLKLANGDNICWCPNSSAPPVPNPVTRYPWPSFRGNLLNNGVAPGNNPISENVRWVADLANGPVDTTPAIADGRVFVSTGGIYNWTTMSYAKQPHIFALNASTGKQLWAARTTAAGWQVSSPAVRSGRVVIGTSDGKVLAFSEETGDMLWSFTIGASSTGVTASPVMTADAVYIAAGDGKLYALSLDGDQLWNISLGGPAYMSTPAISDGKLFVGTDNGTFWCLALNGTPAWNLTIEGKVRSSPVISAEKAFVVATVYDGWTAQRSVLHVLYCADGRRVYAPLEMPATTSSPAVNRGNVYIGDAGGLHVYYENGRQLWETRTEGPIQSSPVLFFGEIFFTDNSQNGSLHIDHSGGGSGRMPWNFTPEPRQYILGSPGIADGFLFFGSDNGKVYCIGGSETPGAAAPAGKEGPRMETIVLAAGLTAAAAVVLLAAARRRREAL